MKKYLLCVALLVLSAASFRTARAEKVCGGKTSTGRLIGCVNSGGNPIFDSDCTSIEIESFAGDRTIRSVDLSKTSITSIGRSAFNQCSNLTSVKFPASLTSIGEWAFASTGLASIDLSNTSVTSIGNAAFMSCSSLTSVKFPASLASINGYAFEYCPLASIDLSNTSVTSIGANAFSSTPLASVKFPASLASIGSYAFSSTSLASVDLSNTSVTSIEAAAFSSCSSLASVKLPASLSSIGESAFNKSPLLASIDLSNTSVNKIERWAFSNIKNPSTITVRYGSKAHELLGGSKGTSAMDGDPIERTYGNNSTLIVKDAPTPTPTPDPLDPTPLPSTPTPTPEPGTVSGAADVIRVVPLPEDEFGSYEVDPVTGEKNYLMFNTYAICMDFLNNEELCSGYERCYHK